MKKHFIIHNGRLINHYNIQVYKDFEDWPLSYNFYYTYTTKDDNGTLIIKKEWAQKRDCEVHEGEVEYDILEYLI